MCVCVYICVCVHVGIHIYICVCVQLVSTRHSGTVEPQGVLPVAVRRAHLGHLRKETE